jgi:hypothetical protein
MNSMLFQSNARPKTADLNKNAQLELAKTERKQSFARIIYIFSNIHMTIGKQLKLAGVIRTHG